MKRKPHHILVIDDNDHNLRMLTSLLTSQGYEVTAAHGGVEALEQVAETSPDMVVSAVTMPGLDGLMVTRTLRARTATRSIPILLVTSPHDLQDTMAGFEAGADDFLSRPYNSVELIARVRSLLRIKCLRDELETRNALLERMLTGYVSPVIVQSILDSPEQDLRLGGESCEVSVLHGDIRGFARIADETDAAHVTKTLNFFFHHLATSIFEHGGTLDKYLGHSMMAFFGAPIPSTDHPQQTVRAAWDMQGQFAKLTLRDPRLRTLGLSIGIGTGQAIVANVGSERFMNYTVIGDPSDTATNFQQQAKAGQILIDEETYRFVREIVTVHPVDLSHLNGRHQRAQGYQVIEMRELVPV